jgi:hypothetical protein
MNNKILRLLPLFLLSTAVTQCMEQKIIIKPRTMQEIRDDRDAIINKRLTAYEKEFSLFDCFFFQEFWTEFISKLRNLKDDPVTVRFKDYRHETNYSVLGIATIAITITKKPALYQYLSHHRKKECISNLRNKKIQKKPSFSEKKAFISILRKEFEFIPTPEDKKFALLEYEGFILSIIEKMSIFQESPALIEIPRELIKHITLLILNTEESLF